MESFVAVFATLGYAETQAVDSGPDWEHVAIYALNGVPTHASRQLASGWWTSKLGRLHDLSHLTPESVAGPLYGDVAVIMRRRAHDTSSTS